MKKSISILVTLLLFAINTYCQMNVKKWSSSAFIDLTSNTSNTYTYYEPNNKIQETSIGQKGALELVYNIDYHVLKKLTAGIIVSYNHFVNPNYSSLKIGTGFKFFYVENRNYYLTLQYGYHIPFGKEKFREGHQIKIGQYFDITEIMGQRLLLGLFYNYDFLYLDGAKPLFVSSNKPSSLKYNSIGISLGAKF